MGVWGFGGIYGGHDGHLGGFCNLLHLGYWFLRVPGCKIHSTCPWTLQGVVGEKERNKEKQEGCGFWGNKGVPIRKETAKTWLLLTPLQKVDNCLEV